MCSVSHLNLLIEQAIQVPNSAGWFECPRSSNLNAVACTLRRCIVQLASAMIKATDYFVDDAEHNISGGRSIHIYASPLDIVLDVAIMDDVRPVQHSRLFVERRTHAFQIV